MEVAAWAEAGASMAATASPVAAAAGGSTARQLGVAQRSWFLFPGRMLICSGSN